MAANYIQPGEVLTLPAATAVASGQVHTVEAVIGIALVDIPAGGTGEVKTTGVFFVPKVAAADIPAGAAVFWDVSESAFNVGTPATGDVTGATLAAAIGIAGQAALAVKFTGAPATIAP